MYNFILNISSTYWQSGSHGNYSDRDCYDCVNLSSDMQHTFVDLHGSLIPFCVKTICSYVHSHFAIICEPKTLSAVMYFSSSVGLQTDGRTDGQTRTATTSTAIAAVTPCRRHCDSSTVSRHKRTYERTDWRRESNLVHFNLKMWHLVTSII